MIPRVPRPQTLASHRFRVAVAAAALATITALPLSAGRNRWTPIGIPIAGIASLAVAPDADATVYAGAANGRLFKSGDHGASWTVIMPVSPSLGEIGILRVSPADPRTLFAVAGESLVKSVDAGASWSQLTALSFIDEVEIAPSAPATLYVANQAEMARSDDGGATWRVLGGIPGHRLYKLAIDPRNAATLYAGTDGPIYKSLDGGITWSSSGSFGPTSTFVIEIDPRDPATLYASSFSAGLWRSSDGGVSWMPIDNGLDPGGIPIALALAPAPATLYATYLVKGQQSATGKVYKSGDRGATWTLLNTRPFEPLSLALDPVDPGRVYSGDQAGLTVSADGGSSWTDAGPLLCNEANALAADPNQPGVLYAVASVGFGRSPQPPLRSRSWVYRSQDRGATWEPAGAGLPPCWVDAIVPDPTPAGALYARTSCGLFESVDSAVSWQPRGLADAWVFDLAVDPHDPRVLFAVGNTDTVYAAGSFAAFRSLDGGASWASIADQLVPAGEYGNFYAVRFDPTHPRRIYIMGDKSFKSVDGGATWRQLPINNGAGGQVYDLLIDPVTPRTLYAVVYPGGLMRSDDGGFHWVGVGGGLPPQVLPAALVIDPFDSSTLYVAYGTEVVYISRDRGGSWTPLGGGGLAGEQVVRLALDPFRPGTLYAGTLGGSVFTYRRRP